MRALGYACEEASLHDLPLDVVLVWSEPEPPWPALGPLGVPGWEEIVEQARRALAETVAGWQEKYPDVPVTTTLALGHPAQVLVEEARDAVLLVVGARGRTGMSGLALGSVSYTVLLHASSPVAVVRDRPGEEHD
jgi:nucleotide-binding universal stress UspA family protein